MELSNDVLNRNEHYDIDYDDSPYRDNEEAEEEFPSDFLPSPATTDEIILTPRDRRRQCLKYSMVGVAVLLVMGILFRSGSDQNYAPADAVLDTPRFPTKFPAFPDNQALKDAVHEYLQGDKSKVIKRYGPIDQWNTTFITDFSRLFDARRMPNAEFFNEDISKWDTRNVFQFTGCFYGCKAFNRPLYWETRNSHHFISMFHGASSFNGGLPLFDVSNGRTFNSMFEDAHAFNQDLSHWELKNVEQVHAMFKGAKSFTSDLHKWNVSYVERFDSMFDGAREFNSNLDPWAVHHGRNFTRMFANATKFDSNLCSWRQKILFEKKNKLPAKDIFNGSACADTRDLWLGRSDFPFCQWCDYN